MYLERIFMASVNDKLINLVPLWSGTIGSGGVANGTDTTIPLASASGLTEGSIYVLTIDRVDSAGTKTLSKREVVIGEVSGDSLINCLRGQEGTAQAHSAGAVVEILFTAKQWNRLIEGMDVEHDADGTHMDSLPLTTPKITTSINDTNGNEVIKTPATASAVNEITVTNSATGNAVAIAATGGDTDISLTIAAKGAGTVGFSSTLASPTITTPTINGAIIGTAYPGNLNFYGANFNPPEGFLINGKIAVSVAANNLTVALKGMDGNDPSATNPVYVRIGDTIKSVTAALSVTKNAGTNWCNAGSAELATKEIDYFVYLGYNATDGVVIGFSRIPYGTLYSSFSTTGTAETYAGISTITNAAAGDNYVNIGRFAATLSAGAGYTWSVPTFTATNLIQRPVYETRWLVYVPSCTGFSAGPSGGDARYVLSHRRCYLYVNSGDGTSNNAGFTISLPITANGSSGATYPSLVCFQTRDNGGTTATGGRALIQTPFNVITVGKDMASANFTASGVKGAIGNMTYEI